MKALPTESAVPRVGAGRTAPDPTVIDGEPSPELIARAEAILLAKDTGRPRVGDSLPASHGATTTHKCRRRKTHVHPLGESPGGLSHRPRTGLNALKARVMLRGLAAVNRRTKAAREVVRWRRELIDDLGGEERLTAASRTRIETIVRTKLLLEHLDSHLLEYGTLFGKKGHLRAPVKAILSERNRMADSVERGLAALGQQGKAGPALPAIADLVGQQMPSEDPQLPNPRSARRSGR
jgi:hypothetical protein